MLSSFARYMRAHHVALIALFVALGGTSYAAIKLPKNSVGATQLKSNSVTATKIKNHSITAADMDESDMPEGPAGPQGSTGPMGPQGQPGQPGLQGLEDVEYQETIAPGGYSSANFDAQCPAGKTVIGTGFNSSVAHVGFVKKYGTFVGGFIWNDSSISVTVEIQAICAQLPPGVAYAKSKVGSNRTQFLTTRRAAIAAH